MDQREKCRLLQLIACGGIFVLLVAVKLLLPRQIAPLGQELSGALERNMDVRGVFSAVGRAVSGESDMGGTLEEVYQAVFHPQADAGDDAATETAAASRVQIEMPSAMELLREFPAAEEENDAAQTQETKLTDPAGTATTPETELSTLAYVLYSEENLPDNVSLEQAILGFDYCTPVMGTLTSNFGYREHPVEGEEKFHYGVDIAADKGTAINCFADGTVTAVGESSSYGKYLIVDHAGDYATLYAHCSRITASSGAAVREGEKIAEVGETGIATGPHLHFELHKSGDYLNPIYYVSLA